MNRYQSYKPSGIEWIGEIPSHWSVSRLKYNIKFNLSYGVLKPDKYFEEDSIPIVRTVDISDSYDISKFDRISPQVSNQFKRTIIQEGDVLISVVGTIGKTMIVTKELEGCNLSRSVCRIVLNGSLNNKFLNYLFNSEVFWVRVFELTSGSIQSVLNLEDLSSFVFPYPLINEQLEIVQFLDDKTELLDKLISTKERKITLLKEQRISLINQIITKGLNPSVKMKNSGVEWIGEIPYNWSVIKLKYVGKISSGDTLESSKIEPEGLYPVFGGNGIMGYHYEYNYSHSVLSIGRVGEKCGNVHKVLSKSWINDNSLVLDFDTSKFNIDYLFHTITRRNLNVLRNQNTQPLITGTIVKNEYIPYPDTKTQNEIVDYLEFKTKEIDDLVQLEQKKIDILKEYRQSLISEVVTGKIKVTTNE
jgi:type I restriction enzyme S subunit